MSINFVCLFYVILSITSNQQVDAQSNDPLFKTHYYPSRFFKSFYNPSTDLQIDNSHLNALNNLNEPLANSYDSFGDLSRSKRDHDDDDDKKDHRKKYNKWYKKQTDAEKNRKKLKDRKNKTKPKQKVIYNFNGLDDELPSYTSFGGLDENSFIDQNSPNDFEGNPNTIDDDILEPDKNAAEGKSDYSYDNQRGWDGRCQDRETLQSPISIHPRDTKLDQKTKLDIGVRYAKDLPEVILKNNGHTVEFKVPDGVVLPITGPALDYEIYRADALHFHWGSNNTIGSEHVLNGIRYPLEMHIVHVNTKYDDFDKAKEYIDGVVVVAIMFEVGKINVAIDPLIRKLDEVRCKNSHIPLKNMNLLRLFPSRVHRLYQYFGSLTTPPCSPTVTWIIIETPNELSREQMSKFRALYGDNLCRKLIKRNWRDLQKIRDREIKRSVKL